MFQEEKLQKAHDGDLKAIEEICSLTWEPVYRFVYYKVQNRQEAEDITQEAYVKAFTYLQRNDVKIEKFIGFLKTTALNILRDKWRKKKRLGSKVNYDEISPAETAVDDATEASTQRTVIQDAMNKLNGEQRTVIELRILKGYSTYETAKIMNKKEVTVRVLQYRALKNLAAILKSYD
ncbi:MAG TPA: sigma-70 family RNA polymerase sigma factor [Acetivibrio sp.]|nr:sigma-70 family RNA polymerase sigma factor [Acetivibrio sp.]